MNFGVHSPRHILMLKSHSMGVGDVLRSSAAWRALKDHFQDAQLHLLFLSKHPGYATESLINEHHLLDSTHFLTLREKSPSQAKAHKTSMSQILKKSISICLAHDIDTIIDFEMHGLRGAWLTWQLQKELFKGGRRVQTIGVGQFWFKRLFYDRSSRGLKAFAKAEGLTLPMDYTLRDFVALSALEIDRKGRPIELRSSVAAMSRVEDLVRDFQLRRQQRGAGEKRFLLCLNIGCGTEDAIYKRPKMDDLVRAMVSLYRQRPFDLILSGAAFEKDINTDFIEAFEKALNEQDAYHQNYDHSQQTRRVEEGFLYLDCAGKTSLPELSALIEICDLVVSTDSGPYHMAVALKVPTLVWFIKEEVASYHHEAWCRHVINPTPSQFIHLINQLLK